MSVSLVNPNLRISGLASGMDTDTMVKNLMAAEKIPLNQMQQQKQLMEWKRDDYRSMNTLLSSLNDTVFNMKLQSTFISKQVTSSTSSVTATAAANVPLGSYTINVKQLASVATISSGAGISADPSNKIDPTKPLSTQSFANGNHFDNFSLITYDANGKMVTQPFTIDPSADSLNDVLDKINNSNLGIRAYYDSNSDRVIMERNQTGHFNPDATGNDIEFDTTAPSFLTTIQMDETNEITGQDSQFQYNGMTNVTFSSHTNSYNLNGLKLNFTSVTNGNVTLNVSNNTASALKTIQDFVSQYNDAIKQINDKISEQHDRNYPPLTDDQKSSMNDTDIQNWTDKAKTGMLSHDSILSSGLSQMRSDLYGPVTSVSNSNYNQLADIGITTSSNYQDHGKLVMDETKIEAALADDPNAVMQLFTNSNSVSSNKDTSTMGLAQRLSVSIQNTIDQVEEQAGNSSSVYTQYYLGRQENDLDQRISDFQSYLDNVENRYYNQFSAMEQAMQQSTTQSNYLTGMLGGSG